MSEKANGSHTAGIEAMQSMRYKRSTDVVLRATKELPDNQRAAILWLHQHGQANQLPDSELGKLIRYDDSTVSRIMTGRYQGNLDNVTREIESARAIVTERAKGRKLSFTRTRISDRIWKVCDLALEFQRVAFIYGPSQIGKTTSLLAYKESKNPGEVFYVRMPAGGSLSLFLVALAKAIGMSPQAKEKLLSRRIIEAFDDRMVLIVDEAHQWLLSGEGKIRPARTVEFIRELHDESHCGLVICGTEVLQAAMDNSAIAGFLKQSKLRRVAALRLQGIPSKDDLATFASAYGLPPADEDALRLQSEVFRDEALGMWLVLLQLGAKLARRADEKMSWKHVHDAWAGLCDLEGRGR